MRLSTLISELATLNPALAGSLVVTVNSTSYGFSWSAGQYADVATVVAAMSVYFSAQGQSGISIGSVVSSTNVLVSVASDSDAATVAVLTLDAVDKTSDLVVIYTISGADMYTGSTFRAVLAANRDNNRAHLGQSTIPK